MSILLSEARAHVRNAVLHCGQSFGAGKIDAAIVETGERLINEGGLNLTTATATCTTNSEILDVSSTTSDFLFYDHVDTVFFAPASSDPGWRKVTVTSLENLRRKFEQHGETTGYPELLAWVDPTTCWLFPVPDSTYTINFQYKKPLTTTTWTIGTMGTWATGTSYTIADVVTHTPNATAYTYRSLTENNQGNAPADNASNTFWELIGATSTYAAPAPSSISLNIENKWAVAWLRSGVRGSLLLGAKGHDFQAERSIAEFERLIERVEMATTPNGVWYADGSDQSSSYAPYDWTDAW